MSAAKEHVLSKYPDYEAVIGIEVHVQLKTNTKIFCACPNHFGDEPNTNICPVCTGHPGALPVLNKKVVEYGIKAGLATNCTIQQNNEFARKHYTYPDLPKNYQITQDDKPICTNGYIPIEREDGTTKHVRLHRIHMEEDAGKNIHTEKGNSLVDLNRAGTPLLEIVSEPDMKSAHEAKAYLHRLHQTVQYLGISDADMEKGSFRCDINVSIKKKSDTQLGTKVEIKNMNSFKFIGQAIEYEIERQCTALQSGESIHQQTRLWDTKTNQTFFMRSKEAADDYRYFPDPDVPLIKIDQAWIDAIKTTLPELPHAKLLRFQKIFGLPADDAGIFVENPHVAHFFEEAVKLHNQPKQISNWILRNLLGYLKEQKLELEDAKVKPAHMAALIAALDAGTINSSAAQIVFTEMATTGKMPHQIIEEKDLKQIGSSDELEAIVLKIIEENPENVASYKSGKDRIFGFFVGSAMKATKGKGDPNVITQLFKKHLG